MPGPLTALHELAAGITSAALVAGFVALARTRRPAPALGVFLDLLLAAGLLRLAADPGGRALCVAAAIVVIRRLVGAGLRVGGRSLTGARGARVRAAAGSELLRRLVRPAWRL